MKMGYCVCFAMFQSVFSLSVVSWFVAVALILFVLSCFVCVCQFIVFFCLFVCKIINLFLVWNNLAHHCGLLDSYLFVTLGFFSVSSVFVCWDFGVWG